jgi:hypothetical protein
LCVIESELGGDLALVINSSSEVCTHTKSEKDSVKVIRRATEDDEKKFSWLQRKERKALEDESLGRLYAEEEKVEED